MITCQFENGNRGTLRHVVVDVLAIQAESILLVKRAPHLSNGGKWGLPGGYLDRDENTQTGAARELLEETGYRAGKIKFLYYIDEPHRRGEDRQNVSFVFEATDLVQVGNPDDESSEMAWFAFDKLPAEADMAFDHLGTIKRYQQVLE